MVGEIRDPETAEIALTAAQTGHLVLSTLHTRDSISAVTRLIDLNIPPFLVASTVTAILAQRLVRRAAHLPAVPEDGRRTRDRSQPPSPEAGKGQQTRASGV